MSRPVTIGVSLKMYFSHRRTLEWAADVADIVAGVPEVEFFAIPTFPSLLPVLEAFDGTRALVGAQDLATEDAGAFTGEVSGAELAEIGVRVVEVGHAERRRLFGETDAVVAAKTSAALRNGLTPVLCVGETSPDDDAAAVAVAQLRSALADAPAGRLIVAYEPVWAIGAAAPAGPAHIRPVCAALRRELDGLPGRDGSSVIYGGSAGPGLLAELAPDADGLFLGRSAHDPAALAAVLTEAAQVAETLQDTGD